MIFCCRRNSRSLCWTRRPGAGCRRMGWCHISAYASLNCTRSKALCLLCPYRRFVQPEERFRSFFEICANTFINSWTFYDAVFEKCPSATGGWPICSYGEIAVWVYINGIGKKMPLKRVFQIHTWNASCYALATAVVIKIMFLGTEVLMVSD